MRHEISEREMAMFKYLQGFYDGVKILLDNGKIDKSIIENNAKKIKTNIKELDQKIENDFSKGVNL